MTSRYAVLRRIIDEALVDEGKLCRMAEKDQAGIAPAILLLADQIAKLRGDLARIAAQEAP